MLNFLPQKPPVKLQTGRAPAMIVLIGLRSAGSRHSGYSRRRGASMPTRTAGGVGRLHLQFADKDEAFPDSIAQSRWTWKAESVATEGRIHAAQSAPVVAAPRVCLLLKEVPHCAGSHECPRLVGGGPLHVCN